ncbi:MAG: histone H2A, partial [Chaenotheca gracillima]
MVKRKRQEVKDSPQISAVAARRQLQGDSSQPLETAEDGSPPPETVSEGAEASENVPAKQQSTKWKRKDQMVPETSVTQPDSGFTLEPLPGEVDQMSIESSDQSVTILILFDLNLQEIRSRSASPETSTLQLSKFSPKKSSVISDGEDEVVLRLRTDETVLILGQFDLTVHKGVVEFMGAILPAGERSYRTFVPSTHSVPPLRFVEAASPKENYAEVEIKAYKSGIRQLKRVSPKFGRIWNAKREEKPRSFDILFQSTDDPHRRPFTLLELPTPWKTTMTQLSKTRNGPKPRTLISGPKSSGKSTFCRHLINHMLTRDDVKASPKPPKQGVVLLDLDPGQPEFSPPGQLSLVHVWSPIFGPPFTHPALAHANRSRVVRGHTIAATSPRDDPFHYQACAADLLRHYTKHLASAPLVINCAGWVLGMGLDILHDLIRELTPTSVVFMADAGLAEVVESLRTVTAKASIPLHLLPSQPSVNRSRTSADLRAMQTQSYFHLTESGDRHLRWDPTPIMTMKPWRASYAGDDRAIHGVMVLGDRLAPEQLPTILDASLAALVLVEDSPQLSTLTPQISSTPPSLPYLTTSSTSNQPLDPAHSRTLGLVYIRHINGAKKILEIITPIPHGKLTRLAR